MDYGRGANTAVNRVPAMKWMWQRHIAASLVRKKIQV
jgi:hypothetical protein